MLGRSLCWDVLCAQIFFVFKFDSIVDSLFEYDSHFGCLTRLVF